MIPFACIAAACAMLCMLVHYELLRALSVTAPRLAVAPRQRIIYVVAGALGSHLLQIGLFAFSLWGAGLLASVAFPGAGMTLKLKHAMFISIESYASLGSAEPLTSGAVRLFAGIEGISGLVLVGWTSAFTYWCMTQYWNDH